MARYKTIAVKHEDYGRLVRMAKGRPLGKQITMILDAIEAKGLEIVDIGVLQGPDDAQEVPLVTVRVPGVERQASGA